MDFLFNTMMGTPVWAWAIFFALVIGLLVLDLGLFNRKDHEIGVSESLKMSAFYIALGLAFSLFVWWEAGADNAKLYLTAYVVEKSLSLDNIFVIALIFTFFKVPRMYQHRVLFWGILGVLVLRGIMITLGAALVAQYHWILYLFAAFLIFTGVKMLWSAGDDEEMDVAQNPIFKFLKRRLNVTEEFHGNRFTVMLPDLASGKVKRFATPLLLALIMIEFIDLLFAVDSIPAVFAITTDPFVVYTSNIFAILGLRALFFALAAIVNKFKLLHYALAALLIFIGSKVFIADLMGWEKFPASVSLGVTFALLTGGVVASLLWAKPEDEEPKAH